MSRLVICIIFFICLICVYGAKANSNFYENTKNIESSSYDVESRRRKTGHYFLYPYHGWYALSWIYWIKVKLIVIAFFVGTAFIWAIQYMGKFYRTCPNVEHTYYGHYRSLEDPPIIRFLQNLK